MSHFHFRQISDCHDVSFLGRSWVESFFIARDATLLAKPRDDATIVSRIASGTAHIEKIHTQDDTWVRVRVVAEGAEAQEGYMRRSEERRVGEEREYRWTRG